MGAFIFGFAFGMGSTVLLIVVSAYLTDPWEGLD